MATEASARHTTPPAHPHVDRLSINRIGLWLFLLSESFLFAALLSSRYFLQGIHVPHDVDQFLGLLLTGLLLLSSLSAYRAEVYGAHGDMKRFQRNILLTIGMGVLFLVGVGFEWKLAFEHFPPETGFGTIFFTTTGIHAFHVITGLVALGIVLRLARKGRLSEGSNWGVEGTVKYWHFVDVAWVFIYPTLYLVN